jgi:hypothetical protein
MANFRDHREGHCSLIVPHLHFPFWAVLDEPIVVWLLWEFSRPDRKVRPFDG